MMKAGARTAVMVMAGFVWLMGPTAQAAPGAGSESRSHHPGQESTVKPASRQLPPEVANAHAQVAAADAPMAAAASAMTTRANDNLQAAADKPGGSEPAAQVIEPDQLNDIDRALPQDNPPAQTAAVAAVETQPRQATPSAPATASSSETNSAWDQSSLIGKIFIGVGALLTFASAARMFMA